MSYLDNFNVERIDSIPEVKQQLRNLRKAIDNKEIGTYTPPSTGIPKTDLSQEVRNSLLKADNAVPKAIETTYSELKSLRDNSQLIPGCWYRITDYNCTTSQPHTKSAGHKFDILVLATSVNNLSEEARAIKNENDYEDVYVDDGDHYVYTGRKVIVHFADVTKELYFWHFVNSDDYVGYYSELSLEELKQLTQDQLNDTLWTLIDAHTVISENEIEINDVYYTDPWDACGFTYSFDSYFSKCNLNAWKIWYCLDNDSSRFVWAADGLYPTYISTPDILNGEHLEFQGVKEFNGTPELFYGTPEQSKRHYDNAGANMGWILRNTKSDNSLVYTNRNTWTELLDNNSINTVIIYDNAFDELNNVYTDNLSSESIVDEGKGVIYRMIDEWNNDCPYDFKNIMYYEPVGNDGMYDPNSSNYEYCYTFNWYQDYSADYIIKMDGYVINNYIGPYSNNIRLPKWYLPHVIIFNYDEGQGYMENIIIKENCHDIILMAYSTSINIGCNCYNIILGDYNQYVTIDSGCNDISVADSEGIYFGLHNSYIGSNCHYLKLETDGAVLYNIKVMPNVGGTKNNPLDITSLTSEVDHVQCIGITSEGNVRTWNPADPSGT